jgi:hypothetical protein
MTGVYRRRWNPLSGSVPRGCGCRAHSETGDLGEMPPNLATRPATSTSCRRARPAFQTCAHRAVPASLPRGVGGLEVDARSLAGDGGFLLEPLSLLGALGAPPAKRRLALLIELVLPRVRISVALHVIASPRWKGRPRRAAPAFDYTRASIASSASATVSRTSPA